jgi:hypothetical protein
MYATTKMKRELNAWCRRVSISRQREAYGSSKSSVGRLVKATVGAHVPLNKNGNK